MAQDDPAINFSHPNSTSLAIASVLRNRRLTRAAIDGLAIRLDIAAKPIMRRISLGCLAAGNQAIIASPFPYAFRTAANDR
jgi:hypothetical protein